MWSDSQTQAVRAQDGCLIQSFWEDVPITAWKVGFLGNPENVSAVAEILSDYADLPVRIEDTLERRIQQLRDELTSAGLQAPVHFYLSDEWFTPDGATAIQRAN